MLKGFIFILVSALWLQAFADSNDDSYGQKAQSIVNQIKRLNPKEKFRLAIRSGLIQPVTNTKDAININSQKILPFIGLEPAITIYKSLSLEGRFLYAQNFLFASSTPEINGTSANMTFSEFGPKYKYVLDITNQANYFSVKLLYHQSGNNFKLIEPEPAPSTPRTLVYMKSYTGYCFGIERGIAATPDIGIIASLDFINIADAKSDTINKFTPTGVGFQLRGEAYKKVKWFKQKGHIGAQYWQTAFSNNYMGESVLDMSKRSHVQATRAISLNYTAIF